ncbi:MAG: iron ABC transporter permease, partial [Proteobacteria bacterium]|nr:iron ABC transporter permease [Pseudomonadota bacterium]
MSDAALAAPAQARIAAAERRRGLVLAGAALAVVALMLVDLGTGPGNIPLADVIRALIDRDAVEIRLSVIVWDIRLPVALQAALLGA